MTKPSGPELDFANKPPASVSIGRDVLDEIARHGTSQHPQRRWEWQDRTKRAGKMLASRLFSLPPELLIKLGRLTFSVCALLAIYLDPTQPTRNVEETYALLNVYIIYSALLVLVRFREGRNARIHYITHCIDIIVLGSLCLLTGELSSPFSAFVGFVLIASAMRWGFSGSLLTAVALSLLYTIVGWPYYDPTTSDLNGLVMRSAYSLVAAVMLGYFASHRDRSRRRLATLAAWPIKASAADGEPWLASSLRHASDVLGDRQLLVVWNDSEEPMGRLVYWNGNSCNFLDIAQSGRLFESGYARPRFHHEPLVSTIGLPAPLAHDLKLDQIEVGSRKPTCCSAPFEAQRYHGRVFVIDPGLPTEDMLSLTSIVADRIAFELEQFAMMQELATAAGWRERGRLARDLHDSVLQDLTAAGLQLKIACNQDLAATRGMLGTVMKLLQEQQRSIRRFVENSRPAENGGRQRLKEQLEGFAITLGQQWNCTLHLDVAPADLMVDGHFAAELCQMVSEVTANAVRHGGAHAVCVDIHTSEAGLELHFTDDGCGIDNGQLMEKGRPQSIRDRVSDLGGSFRFMKSSSGLAMHVILPMLP